MDDSRDPMALWVGTWTPHDPIDLEIKLLREDRVARLETDETGDGAPQDTQ